MLPTTKRAAKPEIADCKGQPLKKPLAISRKARSPLPLTVLPWVKAAIEGELREYPVSRIILREMKQDILDSTPIRPAPDYLPDHVLKELRNRPIPAESTLRTSFTDPHPSSRSNHVSDPTYAKVASMDTGLVRRIETWCRVIEEVYGILDQEQRSIVQLFYWVGVKHYRVAEHLHMSETTVWRMRQDIIWLMAYRMGMLGENPLNPLKALQPAANMQGKEGQNVVGS
jgi:hypothetical protein